MGISTHVHIIDDQSADVLSRMDDESIRNIKYSLMECPRMKWDNSEPDDLAAHALHAPISWLVSRTASDAGLEGLGEWQPTVHAPKFEWLDLDCSGAAVTYMCCELVPEGCDGGSDGWSEQLEGLVPGSSIGRQP